MGPPMTGLKSPSSAATSSSAASTDAVASETAAGTASIVSPAPPVPRWAIHRRLYDWTLGLAHHRHATTALFLVSFAESSFFPIPPDVLQIALTLERPKRAWWYAAVSSAASVLGGVAGYAIGWVLWHAVDDFFFRFIFSRETFATVVELYSDNAFGAIFLAAFTPIPYKVFTIAAGVCEISILTLVVGSAIGRSARFFLVAALMRYFGPPIKRVIEKYFNLACLLLGGLAVLGVMAIRWMK